LKRKSPSVNKPKPSNSNIDLEFIPDSLEQITHSIEHIGYQAKLAQAFKGAIAKAKRATG
jgi:hypothetical protein